MKNRFIKISILITIFIALYIIFFSKIHLYCLFKKVFNIQCPICGMTRAVKSLLQLNIITSLHYNLLVIPVLVFLAIIILLLIYDIIFNKKKIEAIFNYLGKYYLLIILIFVINMIINNIKSL